MRQYHIYLFIYLFPSLVHTLQWKAIKLTEASKLLRLRDFALSIAQVEMVVHFE